MSCRQRVDGPKTRLYGWFSAHQRVRVRGGGIGGRWARASRRRPGRAVAASETPGTGGLRGVPSRRDGRPVTELPVRERDVRLVRVPGDPGRPGHAMDIWALTGPKCPSRGYERGGSVTFATSPSRRGDVPGVSVTYPPAGRPSRRVRTSPPPCAENREPTAGFTRAASPHPGHVQPRNPPSPGPSAVPPEPCAVPPEPGHLGGGHSPPGPPPGWPRPFSVPPHHPRPFPGRQPATAASLTRPARGCRSAPLPRLRRVRQRRFARRRFAEERDQDLIGEVGQ